jgi:hypothetical protein
MNTTTSSPAEEIVAMSTRLCALAVIALAGCKTTAPVAAPAEYIPANQPTAVRVTRADHSVVEVRGPHMQGDTLVGGVDNQVVKIPLSEVNEVSASHVAVGRTVALAVVWGAAVGGGLVYIFSQNASGNSKNVCLTPNDFGNYCGSIMGP